MDGIRSAGAPSRVFERPDHSLSIGTYLLEPISAQGAAESRVASQSFTLVFPLQYIGALTPPVMENVTSPASTFCKESKIGESICQDAGRQMFRESQITPALAPPTPGAAIAEGAITASGESPSDGAQV